MTPEQVYAEAIADLCARLGAEQVKLRADTHDCPQLLRNPKHQCHYSYKPEHEFESGWALDHTLWLRLSDGRLALLTQPYPGEKTEKLAEAGYTVTNIGVSPYHAYVEADHIERCRQKGIEPKLSKEPSKMYGYLITAGVIE